MMIISKTPLRISFAGGGSDFADYYRLGYGAVLSAAIDKFVYVYVGQKFDRQIRLTYWQMESVNNIEELKHELIRETMKIAGATTSGINIGYISSMLPAHEGTGLGGSSSLTVGALNALYAFDGSRVSPKRLAEEACRIEIDILGRPIGKQDQYAAAFGDFNFIRFNSDHSVSIEPLHLKKNVLNKLTQNLMLFYTNLTTKSSDVLSEQKKKIPISRASLDQMVALAEQLRASLLKGDVDNVGETLHRGWLFKKKLASKISNKIIDNYYSKALKAGALGGKILGSGGGGFLLFYCPPERQDNVRQALANLKETPFKFEKEGSKVYTL